MMTTFLRKRKEVKDLSQTARILRLLKAQKRATNRELNRICFRYGARIFELRREGHIIVSTQIKQGLWEFVYMGEGDSTADTARDA